MMDDVIEIKKPDPDSHFKLLPCKCKSDNVAYVHYNGRGGDKWRVTCFDCGYTVDKGNRARHDAQVNWNKAVTVMRKILFRGKRKGCGAWVYGFLTMREFKTLAIFVPSEKERLEYAEPFGTTYCVDPETVGQFTGLTDKNGKKIFEGDICRNTRTNEIVSVKWHGTMAGYVWSKRKKESFLYDFGELFRAYDKYEVIGNIHDNPELLEVPNDG